MTPRVYRQEARAAATAARRESILRAAQDLGLERMSMEVSLDEIAGRAGTSVQTVLRHFGTRDALVGAAVERAATEIAQERRAAPGDLAGGIRALVDHYERRGPAVLTLLARETLSGEALAERGRGAHRRWLEDLLADRLPGGPAREEAVDLLVVATDVYAWKLLRLDRGLTATAVEGRMRRMIAAILPEADHSPSDTEGDTPSQRE